MNTVDKVKQCRTPQEALLVLAAAIDELSTPPADPWQHTIDWDDHETHVAAHVAYASTLDNRAVIENGDVIVKPVSHERQDARYDFAADNRLTEFYGPGLSDLDFREAYVKGGPRWLYYTNRECVMQMPLELRRALVADVLLDSPTEADEIGRDILKFDESVPEGTQVEQQRARLGKPNA